MILLFAACGQKENETQTPVSDMLTTDLVGQKITLGDFIAAKPAGLLSSQSLLEFEFNRAMVLPSVVGQEFSADFLEATPAIRGSAKWLSTSLLQVTPAKPLKSGETYRVRLNGKRVFGANANVDHYDFELKVILNEILEALGTFEAVPGKTNIAKLVLELRFADKVDSAKLTKELQLRLNQKKLPFQISLDGAGSLVKLVSEEVPRLEKAQRAELTLPGSWTFNNQDFHAEFLLAAKGEFVLVSNQESNAVKNEKGWEFLFSDPIADMDVSGFISIEPRVNYKVSVKNRTLRVSGDFVPGVEYEIGIEHGLPGAYGTKTNSVYLRHFSFNDELPALKLLANGLFLPLENKGRIQFRSMNLGSLRIRIQEVLPQNLIFFLQNNDLRSSERSISDIERVSKDVFYDKIELMNAKRNEWLKTELDISNYFNKKPGAAYVVTFIYDEDNLVAPCKNKNESYTENDLVYESDSWWDNPCNSYYYDSYRHRENNAYEKIMIASSVALTAKRADNGIHVWANDVETSKPVSELKLELFGTVNDRLAEQKTNSNGYAFFDVNEEESPQVIRGVNPRGLALLKLSQHNWETSRFDVGGIYEQNKSTRLFGYTERGVHRPGDTIHFAGMVREGVEKPLKNLPLQITVKNPMGAVVFESTKTTSEQGMFALSIPTDLNAPTGYWTALISSGGNEWRHRLQVETIKPNRLKNTLELPERLTGSTVDISGTFTSKYLFGTPASGLKADIRYTLKNQSVRFSRFPDFTFRNPLNRFEGEENEILFSGNLDEQGQAKISEKMRFENKHVPEVLTLNILAKVQETGGGFTESRHSAEVYPYSVFVGLKRRNSWDGIRIGDTLRVPVIALDQSGKPVAGRKLSVKVYQNAWYSWWERRERDNGDDRWDFRKQQRTYLVYEETLQSAVTPKEFNWIPETGGQIFVEVQDTESGHSAAQFIYASSWGGYDNIRDIPEASHLNLVSKLNSYNVGDSIVISFDAPAKGTALVNLEYASSVLESKMIEVAAGKNRVSFIAAKNMLPNVYAVVSLFQPIKNVEGEKPLRYYGVLPIKVEDEKTKLPLRLQAPEQIEPGDVFTVEVENRSAENASFTLSVVDEGLLDLTRFKTPDPWKFYFQKIALGVRSSDNYDEFIGALMPDMDAYLSIGGDMELDALAGGSGGRKDRAGQVDTQRFKAVSLFSGVREVKAGKKEKVTFTMPQYVGSVRVQLIGSSERGLNSQESYITVKQPLMILPTVPRAAKPGDRFKIPVSVFAMDSAVKNVSVSLQVSKELSIQGESRQKLYFSKPGEQDVNFDAEVLRTLGSAQIIVKAEGGKYRATDTIHLPVMSSSALFTEVSDKQLLAGETWDTEIEAFGISNTHHATLVLSTMPSLRFGERLDYLIHYPYGCLEQTTSSVFPQLYVNKFRDLDSRKKQEITENINAGIKRLSTFTLNRGFSYWPNQSSGNADSWSTSYAGHFMLEAKNAGYSVPKNLLETWKNWEIEASKKSNKNFRGQTYRLFLLAMAGSEQMGPMNLIKENHLNQLDWASKYLLAGAYYFAGNRAVADQILEHPGSTLKEYREYNGSYGSGLRDQALVALVLSKMGKREAFEIYRELAKSWNSQGWWSTQESAFMLLAFAAISENISDSEGEISYTINGDTKKVSVPPNKPLQINLSAYGSAPLSVTALSGTVFAELQTRGLPLEDRVQTDRKGMYLERTIVNNNGNPIAPSQIKQGESFWLLFAVKSLATVRVENMALSSLLPSGFEISIDRLHNDAKPSWLRSFRLATPDYLDIRDDRVNWFFGISPNEVKVFAVQIHPSYAGEFRWPGVVLEAMYSPDYFARIAGERIHVK